MLNRPDVCGVVLPELLPVSVAPASSRAGLLPAKPAVTLPGEELMSTVHFVDYAGFTALLQ